MDSTGPQWSADVHQAGWVAERLAPDDPVSRVEDWVTAWVDELANSLLARGEASLTTSRGSVEAWLRRPGRLGAGELRTELTFQLTHAVLDLAGM